ncbi:MAG: hypothetical protein HC844_04705 [Tabrizicola sp.]|nr:hypothetical protein [Tabrizicola sp.]
MQDKTITNALIILRKQIIRGKLDGPAHVYALLAARGIDPAKVRVGPKRKPDQARQGMMRLMVLEALRDGPRTAREVAAQIASWRPEIPPEATHKRTTQAMDRLRVAGLVKREGRLWGLAQ